MALELVTIPCLEDNYAFLIHDARSGDTAVVDVPEPAPILAELKARGWTLSHVFLTHHHWDHIDGLPGLLSDAPAAIYGAAADVHRLPPLDVALAEGDVFQFGGEDVHVMDVSGHTIGHIALHLPTSKLAFTADSLMALGCGRLFEGSPAQMHDSMQKLSALPPDTLICSGHEYTSANARFAITIEPENPQLIFRIDDIAVARASGRATVPSTLQLELDTNPFLRAHIPAVKSRLGMETAADVDVFTEIRARKDRF
ncbi:hydroxyacylglutathione hydrolase [Roseobacteraceae bacterium S113]